MSRGRGLRRSAELQERLGELPAELDYYRQEPAVPASMLAPARARAPIVRQRARFAPVIPFVTLARSTLLLQDEPRRSYLLIVNTSGGTIFVNFSALATIGGIPIIAGGNYEPFVVPVNEIWIVGSAAGLTGVVTEGV